VTRKKITNKLDFLNKFGETRKALASGRKKISSRFSASIRELVAPQRQLQKLLSIGVIFFAVLTIISGLYFFYQKACREKFYIGLSAGGIDLGNKTIAASREELLNKADEFSRKGLVIIYKDKKVNIAAAPVPSAPDSSVDLFSFKVEKTLADIFSAGRRENIIKNAKDQLLIFILSPDKPIEFYLDEERIRNMLYDGFYPFEEKAQSAEIAIINDKITIRPEIIGKIFNYNDIVRQIKKRIAYLDSRPVEISLKTDYPEVYAEELALILPQAKKLLATTQIKLKLPAEIKNKNSKNTEWEIDEKRLVGFLTAKQISFQYNIKWLFSALNKKFYIGLKKKETEKYLREEISPAVDIEPVDAKFTISGNKVAEFISSQKGQKLDIDGTFKLLENAVVEAAAATALKNFAVELIIKEVASEITNENVNDLGIKEVIGTGHSNFAGSPSNRRHNIAVGARAVHGTLIKPGETFSLNKTLGEVNAETGYLPELVIKENKTVPEYGGGLCQIGTTAFRAALDSGLPIAERRNHSYRVRYYEPAGTDATIYSPAPDFKFINDTGHYVLIQRRIIGDDLYFDVWGTDDGRKVTKTEPKIYNIKTPPPTKIIITDELPSEEKKCTEHAVNGADASFYYKVEYSGGEIKEETFLSHYRPWQEVCLIGATSTPETVDNLMESSQ